jgi:hypothetical protein
MGLPLAIIVMLHSAGLMLFHYAIFLFITLKLRNNGAGLAVMLVSCLAYGHAFYLPMEQHNECLVLGVLLWAFVHPEFQYTTLKERRKATIGALLTIVLISFFHPLGIFMILFVLGLEMVQNKKYRDKELWFIIIAGCGWFLLKTEVIFKQGYDNDRLVSPDTIIKQLPDWKIWGSTHFVTSLFWNDFHIMTWLTIVCLLISIRKGIWFFLFCTGFVLLYSLIYLGTFYGGGPPMALESYFTIYGFFTGIIFVCLFNFPRRKNMALLLSLPFLFVGIHKIYTSHRQFTYRISYLSRIINDARIRGMKKCFIDTKCYPGFYAEADWDVAFETLLYSSLPGPDSSVTIFIKNPSFDSICNTCKDKRNIFFGAHYCPFWYTSNLLPQKYMRLPPTGYGYLTNPQEDTSFHDTVFSSKNIKITPLEQTISLAAGSEWMAVIQLKIENNSGKVIPAIPREKNPVELSYSMYDKDGNKLATYLPTPFETDIVRESVYGLIVYLPRDEGTYTIKPDIITVGKREWNLPCSPITLTLTTYNPYTGY